MYTIILAFSFFVGGLILLIMIWIALYCRFSTNWINVEDNCSLIRRSIGYGRAGRYSQQLRPEASFKEEATNKRKEEYDEYYDA